MAAACMGLRTMAMVNLTNVDIVPSKITDLGVISFCHADCFPEALPVKLGAKYVQKNFEWFLKSPNRFLYHILENEQVAGYVGGFCPQYNGDGSVSGMLQYSKKQAFQSFLTRPWLLFHVEIRKNFILILQNLLTGGKKGAGTSSSSLTQSDKRLSLVVIGVHPTFRGKKVFEMLMLQFEQEARQRELERLFLVVKKKNRRAIAAYKKVGWQEYKRMNDSVEMWKRLNQTEDCNIDP